VRETAAAASALVAYLTTVLPRVRKELRRWGPLPAEKAKNAEAVAVFATLAPRPARAAVVRAVTALQVAIDHRDAIEEAGAGVGQDETAQLAELEASWRRDVATLPAHRVVASLLEQAVARCEEGQRRTHAAAAGEVEALQDWASGLGASTEYRWWEVAAGASSSVAAHALIAAAADPGTTPADAAAIDGAYNPPIGALTVLLEDLVDLEEDRAGGEHSYVGYYESAGEAADRIASVASRAEALLAGLPRSPRHRAILAGVAAFYLSDAAAETPFARPIRVRLLATLGPGTRLLAGFMRARRLGERKRSEQVGNSPGP
jgi:hypothetical protein